MANENENKQAPKSQGNGKVIVEIISGGIARGSLPRVSEGEPYECDKAEADALVSAGVAKLLK